MTANKKTQQPETLRLKARPKTMKRRTTTDLAYDVSWKRFKRRDREYILFVKKIFLEYIDMVMDGILDGKLFRMPMRLGHILISKFKGQKRIDWKNTVLHRKFIYHNNFSTDGYSFRFKWARFDGYAMFKNMRIFKFFPTRGVKRKLKEKVTTQYVDYAIYTTKYDLVRLDKRYR